ncbi:hypothetical protein AB3S75_007370 [Citrus x aurantiifolia]
MERKPLAAAQTNREYEKFEPSTEWAREDEFDTLIANLPGFRKEQLKVQVTTSKKMRISGERPLGNNKWSSFRTEFPISSNYDFNEISAKFEGGKLFIKHPKIITPADHQQEEKPQAQAVTEAPKPQKPESDYSEAHQKREQDQQAATATQQVISPPSAAGTNGPEKSGKVDRPRKSTIAEKQSSRKANNNEEAKAASVEAKPTATQKNKHLAEEVKSTSGAREAVEKDKKVVDYDAAASAEAGKEAAGSLNERASKYRTEDLKQALGGLVMELKQPRKIMNFTVAILLVLVVYIYAKNAIGYIGKSKN